MRSKKMLTILVLGLTTCWAEVSNAKPMGTAWTYQGRLMDANDPADGLYDFEFRLFDDPCAGTQQGGTIEVNDLDVTVGYFTVELDFGSDVFNGNARWLETTVAQGDGSDPYTLRPRFEVTAVPYALQTRGIFVDGNENVGIGTDNPEYDLDVQGSEGTLRVKGVNTSYPNGQLILEAYQSSGNRDPVIHFRDGDGTALAEIHSAHEGPGKPVNFEINNHQNGYMAFRTNSTEYVRIDADGNVGIGTTSPTSRMDVLGGEIRARRDSVQYIKIRDVDPNGGFITGHSLENNKKGLYIQNLHDGSGSPRGDTFMSFMVGNELSPTRAMVIQESGNVGIGTQNPQEKLEVNGKLSLTGATYSTMLSDDGGALMIDTSRLATVAQVRLLPYDNDIWLQNINSGGRIYFSGYGGEDLTGDIILKTAGNVGIGDSTPTEKLDVEGNVDVSGNRVKNYRGFPRPDYDSGWQSFEPPNFTKT
ncbi:MAG: hypothetical protein ACYS67_18465, partial [Planctomycetota bacterium]